MPPILRSFIKRIEFEPGQVTIDYTIPLPTEKDGAIEREVLSIKQTGSAGRTRTYDQAVNSRPLYRWATAERQTKYKV